MKKGIHPNYHFVNVVLNDGTTYRTRTTWGEPDGKLTLDIDPSTHPAWTGGQQNLLDRGGRPTPLQKTGRGFFQKKNTPRRGGRAPPPGGGGRIFLAGLFFF